MIHIDGDLYLDADDLQFVIVRKRVKEKSGEVYKTRAGYYPSLASVIRALFDMKAFELASQLESIEAAQISMTTWAARLEKELSENLKADLLELKEYRAQVED